jgi:predicted dehydrogenase
VEVVRKHGRVFQTGSQQRTEFGSRFVDACEHVRNGHIGRVLTVNVGVGDPARPCDLAAEELEPGLDWDRWQGPVPLRAYNSVLSPRGIHGHYPRWRSYLEYAGGGLSDMGAHHFDIGQWGLGRDGSGPVRVEPPADPGALRGAAVVYEDGVRMTHGGPSGTTFIGDGGLIHVDRGRLSSTPGDILQREFSEDEERLPRPANHAANWLECIHSRERPVCDVEVGASSVAVCHLLNLAYRHREAVGWDPARWRFVSEDGGESPANAWLDYERRPEYDLPSF